MCIAASYMVCVCLLPGSTFMAFVLSTTTTINEDHYYTYVYK